MRDVDLRSRTVLVRVDYNVPLNFKGEISDDLRIRATVPTLKYLLRQNCKIVLISHLGRPQGKDEDLSLAPIAQHLAKIMHAPVRFIDDCIGDRVRQMVRHAPNRSMTLLENLRFYSEEEEDDLGFAKEIAKAVDADYFVQDGFGVVHREHASTHAITMWLPGLAGDLLKKEYLTIAGVMAEPKKPVVAIIGGVKVSDKIKLIHRLIDVSDKILIGGAMANTFLHYRGYEIGNSVAERDQKAALDDIYEAAKEKVGEDKIDDFLVLPKDVAVGAIRASMQERREVSVDKIPKNLAALDIGSETIGEFSEIISKAKTVIWNGPLGDAEVEVFSIGSARVAMAIAQNSEATSIVGGGDTADFVLKWDGHDGASFSHVSTGGGASMELMSGQKLPGVESLLDAYGL